MKPFLKWAGGKHRLAPLIAPHIAGGERLVEPFAGSCAVFLASAYQRALLNDINTHLVELYGLVRSEGEGFIDEARLLFSKDNNTEERFYELRSEFNRTDCPRRRAALFIYLNRHAYNGLCRYNRSGGFNVPFGRYSKTSFPEEALRDFVRATGDVEFVSGSFRKAMEAARNGDVIYCDPPYVPLSLTSSFTSYAPGGFDISDQRDLADLARVTSARGIKVVISNHDTPVTRELYNGAEIVAFDVRRSVGANKESRGTSPEILAVFNPR